jgi:hypothetical protein
MISSCEFLDRNIFPGIKIDKEKLLTIKTDINNFRINDSWNKSIDNNINKKEQPNNKFFYFRLSGLNLYYSNTKTDINILHIISVKSMHKILPPSLDVKTEYITTCFELFDIQYEKYKICGIDKIIIKN